MTCSKKIRLFINCAQLQGFPIHTLARVRRMIIVRILGCIVLQLSCTHLIIKTEKKCLTSCHMGNLVTTKYGCHFYHNICPVHINGVALRKRYTSTFEHIFHGSTEKSTQNISRFITACHSTRTRPWRHGTCSVAKYPNDSCGWEVLIFNTKVQFLSV